MFKSNAIRLITTVLAAGFLSSVSAQTSKPASKPASRAAASKPASASSSSLLKGIESAHNKAGWYAQPGVKANVVIEFGGNVILDGTMTMAPHASLTRIEKSSGDTVVYDGNMAWVSPEDAEFPRARFHALTWPYFLAAPFKLDDSGATVAETGVKTMNGNTYATGRLTFDEGVGDAPDDWYILYADSESHVLEAMAYIVTFGKDTAEAEKDPHAITYENYETIDGIPVPMTWQFWNWNREQGIHGDRIGRVELSNFQFTAPSAEAFQKPADARSEHAPK